MIYMIILHHFSTSLSAQTSSDQNEKVRMAIESYIGGNYERANTLLSELFLPETFSLLSQDMKKWTCIYYAATKLRLDQNEFAEQAIDKLLTIDPSINLQEVTRAFESEEHFPAWFSAIIETKFRTITFISDPPSADLYLDNSYFGKTAYTISNLATFKTHKIKLIKENCQTLEQDIKIGKNDTVFFRLDCSGLRTIHISSTPQNANIFIDGTKQDQKTNTSVEIEPGEHQIIVKKGWFRKKSKADFTQETDSLHFVLKPHWWKIGGVAAAITGGIIYALDPWNCRDGEPLPLPPNPPVE